MKALDEFLLMVLLMLLRNRVHVFVNFMFNFDRETLAVKRLRRKDEKKINFNKYYILNSSPIYASEHAREKVQKRKEIQRSSFTLQTVSLGSLSKTAEDGDGNFSKTIRLITQDKKCT